MDNTNPIEIIDLTTSNCYTSRNPPQRFFNNEVIELDDSYGDESNNFIANITINPKKKHDNSSNKSDKDNKEKPKKVGLCSICWDDLGNRPLASTKCGHVYCLTCLEKSLKTNHRCPTCRRILKGPQAYHPLYLELW